MLLAAALRLVSLDAGWFGVDQARDLTWAQLIARGEAFPALGPLMRNRFYLGATYYWFWSLPFLVLTGPLAGYVYAALLGTVTVVLVWAIARAVGGVPAALAAAALFATDPLAVIDGRVAWAPAALPPWSACLVLSAIAFLRRPAATRAAVLLFVAALGTQLHLAAAPLAMIAGAVVLSRIGALSWRGLLAAVVAGAVPLLPMLAGVLEPLPVVAAATSSVDPRQHRVSDLMLLVPRVLDGLTPLDRPRLVDLWLLLERASFVATLAAAAYALLRPTRSERPVGSRLVALYYLAGVTAVALLPAEAWYYYLGATLVPAAVVLGVAWQSLRWRRAAAWILGGVVVARALLVLWWVHANAASGYVATNLDLLRLGGPRPVPEQRARLLDVATRTAASTILIDEIGVPLERVWRDAHGSGFSDLDTDNGYFFRRAAAADGNPNAARTASPADATKAIGTPSVAVVYRGDFPDAWLAHHGPRRTAGPLELRSYAAALDLDAATLVGCGDGAVPQQEPPTPLGYGSGEPPRPLWPCAEPEVTVPVRAVAADVALRVFARVDGAGRVLGVAADPPGTPVATAAPGAGTGLELAPGTTRLTVRLAIDGPARLDLYELHGLR